MSGVCAISPFPLLPLWSWPPSSLTLIIPVASSLVSTLTHSPLLLVFCKAQKWFCKNLRPWQFSPLSPPVTGLLLFCLCLHSPFFTWLLLPCLLVLNTPDIFPWPLHLPIPLWGAASPGLPEPLPLPQICSHPLWAEPCWPHCGLTSLLYFPSPWAILLFLLVLKYLLSGLLSLLFIPTVERNSRGSVSSWLNSLCPDQCLVYSQSSINTCWNGQMHRCFEKIQNENKWKALRSFLVFLVTA